MPRRSPIPPGTDPKDHPALKGGHVVILSGEKPIFKQHMQGPQGHAALGGILERDGFDYEPVHGKYSGDKQPGYIVHARNDSEVEKLKGIAKRMGQEAIVHSQAGKHQYVYTAGPDEGKATAPSSGVNWFGDQEPDDNYSTLYGPSGEPLGHFSYNIDFGSPLVQHGPTQMVSPPEAAQQVLKAAVESYRGILLDLRKREDEKLMRMRSPERQKSTITKSVFAKYQVEGHSQGKVTNGPKPVSDDISAQGFAGKPTNPNNDLVTGGGPISHIQPGGANGSVTRKAEEGDYARIRSVREAEGRELAHIPMRHPNAPPWPKDDGRPVPSIAEEREAANKKTRKTETPMKLHDLMKAQAAVAKMQPLEKPPVSEAQRRAMYAAASGHSTLKIPKSVGKDFVNADKGGKLPEVKKGTLESKLGTGKKDHLQSGAPTGTNMPMGKAQCTCGQPGCKWCGAAAKPKSNEQGEHGGGPKQSSKPGEPKRVGPGPVTKAEMGAGTLNNPAREGSQVNVAGAGKKPSWQPMGTAMKAEYHPTPSYQGSRDVSSPHSDGSSLSVNRPSHPFSDPARSTTGGSMVIKNSIFKKAPEMNKAETIAHATAKRNGGTIKLGKQEFYIDLANASDPKKRLRETNPVKESVVPGGKETGWQTGGTKPKVVEHSASGGAIKSNAPKTGPDQKNTAENSVVEGALKPKAAPKNDLIEKASEDFHKRTGGRFQKPKKEQTEESTKPEPRDAQDDEGLHDPMTFEKAAANYHARMAKAAASMAAPKAPSAAGAGSPTLSAKPPAKPPAAAPGGKPMGGFGKAEFGIKQGAQQASFEAQHGQAGAAAPAPKATPQHPSAYDPSLYQPSGPVHSGLELAPPKAPPVAPPGTGVTPIPASPIKPRSGSPAQHRGITGFLGKGEMCKSCGKMHKAGKCA